MYTQSTVKKKIIGKHPTWMESIRSNWKAMLATLRAIVLILTGGVGIVITLASIAIAMGLIVIILAIICLAVACLGIAMFPWAINSRLSGKKVSLITFPVTNGTNSCQ